MWIARRSPRKRHVLPYTVTFLALSLASWTMFSVATVRLVRAVHAHTVSGARELAYDTDWMSSPSPCGGVVPLSCMTHYTNSRRARRCLDKPTVYHPIERGAQEECRTWYRKHALAGDSRIILNSFKGCVPWYRIILLFKPFRNPFHMGPILNSSTSVAGCYNSNWAWQTSQASGPICCTVTVTVNIRLHTFTLRP